jgi:hypothetical protein
VEPNPIYPQAEPQAPQPEVTPPTHDFMGGLNPFTHHQTVQPTTVQPPIPEPTQPISMPTPTLGTSTSDQPIAVVQVLSTRGVEYTMMTLALWFGAASLIWLLLSLLNGDSSYDTLSLPVSALVVSVPVFGLLFLKLRRDELANPELRLDPSKRRLSQFTQIFAFAAVFFNIIGLVYEIMQKMAGHYSGSVGKLVGDVAIIFVIAGGVLFYYWVDEHRLARRQ